MYLEKKKNNNQGVNACRAHCNQNAYRLQCDKISARCKCILHSLVTFLKQFKSFFILTMDQMAMCMGKRLLIPVVMNPQI